MQYNTIQILYSLRITTCYQHEVHNLTRLFCYNNTKWLIDLGREKVSCNTLSHRNNIIGLINYGETEERAHDPQIVKAKENLKSQPKTITRHQLTD